MHNTTKNQKSYEKFYTINAQIVNEILDLKWNDGGVKRRLKGEHLNRLKYSVEMLVRDCVAIVSSKKRKGLAAIKLGRDAYGSQREDKNLTYSIHIERAYKGMIQLGYLKETSKGYYQRNLEIKNNHKNRLTRYEATDKLICLFSKEEQKALSVVVPPKVIPLIRVRIKRDVNGVQHSVLVAVDESVETERMRKNLEKINRVMLKNWYDLEIDDEEMLELESRLVEQEDERQIDLSRRTLYRVFNDRELTKGGRFYGGWWQNVPKEYRNRLLVNGKRMVEFDYSNQHPTILYAQEGITIEKDCYRDVIRLKTLPSQKTSDNLRSLIKSSFNAMLNATHPLTRAPKGVSPSEFGLTWSEVSEAIKKFHASIAHHFYSGIGLLLQRIDSDIAEQVLLTFANKQIPILPLHDSFLVHSGYQNLLQDVMVTEFKARVLKSIKVDQKHLKFLSQKPSDLPPNFAPESFEIDDLLRFTNIGHEKRLEAFRQLNHAKTNSIN